MSGRTSLRSDLAKNYFFKKKESIMLFFHDNPATDIFIRQFYLLNQFAGGAMEFCPKCSTLLVPGKVERVKRLICPRCGYKGKIKKRSAYKISEKGGELREVAVVVEEVKKRKPVEREYELEPPEYYEEFYEE